MKSKKQTGRVTSSQQEYATAALREAKNFVKNVTYDYPATDRFMIRSAEKIMRKYGSSH